jgi:hypothetical protein
MWMTSSHYGLYGLGYPCATKVITKSSTNVNSSESEKSNLGSDCSLKLENMKEELLVIVN